MKRSPRIIVGLVVFFGIVVWESAIAPPQAQAQSRQTPISGTFASIGGVPVPDVKVSPPTSPLDPTDTKSVLLWQFWAMACSNAVQKAALDQLAVKYRLTASEAEISDWAAYRSSMSKKVADLVADQMLIADSLDKYYSGVTSVANAHAIYTSALSKKMSEAQWMSIISVCASPVDRARSRKSLQDILAIDVAASSRQSFVGAITRNKARIIADEQIGLSDAKFRAIVDRYPRIYKRVGPPDLQRKKTGLSDSDRLYVRLARNAWWAGEYKRMGLVILDPRLSKFMDLVNMPY
jgi:hypothetical protein